MPISFSDKQIDGKISESFLTSLSSLGWFNYDYKCLGCEGIFTNVMDLEKHSLKCTRKRCHNSCTLCLKDFPSYSTFLNHITEKHQPFLKYSCIVCSEFRWSFTELFHHTREAHPEHTIFFCLYCGKNYFTGALLRDHLIIHKPDIILPEFQCDLCEYKAHMKKALVNHMLRFHLEKKFICECCSSSFQFRAELFMHQQSHSNEVAKEECSACGKMFKNKRSLRRHMRSMHEDSGDPVSCEICGKVSKNKRLQLAHMKVHSDKDFYKCKFCGRSFKHSSGFRYHVRTHTGERPYLCPVANCGLKFIDLPNTKKHIKSTHGLTGVKPIHCKK